MNVQCPECSTVYRIDPARVPYEGVAARCRECGMVFRVEAGVSHAPGEVATATPVAEPDPGAPAGPENAQPAEETTVETAARTAADAPEPATGDEAAIVREPASTPDEPAPPPAGAATAPVFGPQDPRTRAGRLARALVSDIKVYNPEKWEQSRADGTLRKEFRDEILKSWEEYVEQVGDEMAKKTPFFRDALNDILAGGDRVF